MKRLLFALALATICALGSFAQKFALIDMEYILKNYPQYEMANEQLNQLSLRWQKEVEAKTAEAETLYKNYQADMVFLTDEQKKSRENAVLQAEKETTELKYKYFGPEGELYKKRQTLMQPIQDEIYNAIKKISEERGYQCVFDRASSANIIYASPRIDISNEVLEKLGYSK
ncbi:MAG: OmpH family outer membrane protein [Muribaculaceae bacterium]|nr:OmpH family outer membrane protein [Muribaculaceae bacterium]MDE5959719.1 OmpH family outer membrane protein [Muribaculaceae bacterium]MDE5972472.1 OmpH family outer membrane protein [Muribaculaceae bacterium]MDE6315049.1 OmpH family outer membrane protein [Muribaculaceae bacterium]MDE6462905.1 OmpH family outer membrane protein [Muribaculaceae bacterium]